MLKELTEDCFKTVISLVESGKPEDIFTVISKTSAEDCARLYVASLLLQYRPFPEKIRVSKYSTVLNDHGAFFELYKFAACHGISISEVESLYNSSDMPEMIWTEVEKENVPLYDDPIPESSGPDSSLYTALVKLGVKPVFTRLKPGACPCSTQAKMLRKNGAKIQSYKVVFNGHSIIVNEVNNNGDLSYDINTLYCKDGDTFRKEFKRKFLNK